MDLSGYSLLYSSVNSTLSTLIEDLSDSIDAYGFLVYGGGNLKLSYPNLVVAGTWSTNVGLKDIGGGVALSDGTTIVSSMGWGDATTYVNTNPATAPDPDTDPNPVTRSMALFPDGYVTGDNSMDFTVTTTPTPGGPNVITD